MNNTKPYSTCPMAKINSLSGDILSYIRGRLRILYPDHIPFRAFHAKTIGVVEARVVVEPSLPPGLSRGLFASKTFYKAHIRFSNGAGSVVSDQSKSLWGMAIKILDLDEAVIAKDNGHNNHDIILFTPRISLPGPANLQTQLPRVILGTAADKASALLRALPSLSVKAITGFLAGTSSADNLLNKNYYSATPYAFGPDKAIKWHALSLNYLPSVIAEAERGEDFLTEQLALDILHWNRREVSFGLYVQFQENPATEPIEDPSVRWKTRMHRVGTIVIPPQELTYPDRKGKDLQLDYSPGHAITDHAPLGAVNQIRRQVYENLALDRREMARGLSTLKI